ncbi:hypothetical protein [Trujillonella humicola]|uniref:hypothetical protein n=1 Tax=Trujillonella humicola TaxID=3383699 RepID=UPI003906A9F4
MADLSDLVRRRLWELDRSSEEASRNSRWIIPPQVVELLSRRGRSFISEGLAGPLARALDVTETRLRRAAGLPSIPDPRSEIDTRPDLRVVGQDS